MPTFGERLRQLRNKKKLTQKELGKLFKISESAVGMYERDEREPSFELTKTIANFFDVSVDYLFGRTDTPSVPMPEPENLPPLLQDLDPELVRKFYEAMNDPLEELFFDDILSASKEEREELIREFLILKKERKKHLNKGKEQK